MAHNAERHRTGSQKLFQNGNTVISAAIIHDDNLVIVSDFLQRLIRENDETGDRATVVETRKERTDREK